MNKLGELAIRCWRMGSAGKRNTGQFGCYNVKVMFSGAAIGEDDFLDSLDYAGVNVKERNGNVIGTDYFLYSGLDLTDKIYRENFLKYAGKGGNTITSFGMVGILNCGSSPDQESKQSWEMLKKAGF